MTILELQDILSREDPSTIQRISDSYAKYLGYNPIPFGNVSGKKKTRKGTPDSYSYDSSLDEYTFFQTNTVNNNVYEKINNDLDKCFKKFEEMKIESKKKTIICFSISDNLAPEDFQKLTEACKNHNSNFRLICSFELANGLLKERKILNDVLNISFYDNYIKNLTDFIEDSKKYAGVDHSLEIFGRDKEIEEVLSLIKLNEVLIIYGDSGVGKSMLACKVLQKVEGNVLCMHHTENNFVSDLINRLEKDVTNYIFFDDINDIPYFKVFLDEIASIDQMKVKIICTVRKYFLNGISKILCNYKFNSQKFEVKRIAPEIIRDILKENFNITHYRWVQKIVTLCKGNPRICKMASEVGLKNGYAALRDSKNIMCNYFEQAISTENSQIIQENFTFLFVVAFFGKIDLNDKELMDKILSDFGLTVDQITISSIKLSRLELISFYENRLIEYNDQNLFDYIIFKYLFDLRKIEISDFIIRYFGKYRINVIKSIKVLVEVYTSNEMFSFVEKEVNLAWNNYENEPNYKQFVESFYIFNINKTLLFIKNNIFENKTKVNSFSNFEKIYDDNDFINLLYILIHSGENRALTILFESLNYKEYRNYAYRYLKELSQLKNENFINGKIENIIIDELPKYINENWYERICYMICKESLKFEFDNHLYNSKNSITFQRLQIDDEIPGIVDFRSKVWMLAKTLNVQSKYNLVKEIVSKYYADECKKILENDILNINILFQTIYDRDRNELLEKILYLEYEQFTEKYNITTSNLAIKNRRNLHLIKIIIDLKDLRLSYLERKNKNASEIKKIAKTISLTKLVNIFELCSSIRNIENAYQWKVNLFIDNLIASLDNEMVIEFFNSESFAYSNFIVKKYVILRCTNILPLGKLLKQIEILANNEKLELTYQILQNIPKNKINNETISLFNKFLDDDLLSKESSYRNLELLLTYSTSDNNFIDLLEKIFKSNNKQKIIDWYNLFLNKYVLNYEQCIQKFKNCNKIPLLKEIIIFIVHNLEHYGISDYIFELSKDDLFFYDKIVEIAINDKDLKDNYLFAKLWSNENYLIYADRLFDIWYEKTLIHSFGSMLFEHLLVTNSDNSHKEKSYLWGIKKIEKEIKNNDKLDSLLDILIGICPEHRNDFMLKITKLKYDPLKFEKLLFLPRSRSWCGSEITIINKNINENEKLLAILNESLDDIVYAEKVSEYLKYLSEYKKNVEIRERLEFSEYF